MYRKTILSNGLRVVSSHMPHVRSVSLCLFVEAGSRYESAEKAGISHFVEHLLFKGTRRRPTALEISEAIEGTGGVLNGGTDKEMTVYWAKVARPHFDLAFDVLADMIFSSVFDPTEVEKERQVIIEELAMSMDSPQQRVCLLIDEAIWPDQTLGRDVAGSKATVSALTRQELLDYHSLQYAPGAMVASVAGNIPHDEVVATMARLFGDRVPGTPGPWFPAVDGQTAPRYLEESKETEQAHLCVALRGVSSSHTDCFAFDLINVILGGGMSSRLFMELRERRALVYDIHSYVNHFRDSGSITVYAGLEPKNLETGVQVILEEFAKLKNLDVPETELLKAKEMAKGRLMLSMEDTRSVSGWNGTQEVIRQEIKTVDEMVTIIDAITVADIRRVAANLFHSNGLSVALVGSASFEERLRPLLQL